MRSTTLSIFIFANKNLFGYLFTILKNKLRTKYFRISFSYTKHTTKNKSMKNIWHSKKEKKKKERKSKSMFLLRYVCMKHSKSTVL